jgi:hypothetical protein
VILFEKNACLKGIKPGLLRKAVAAAADTVEQAVAASACGTGVARHVVGIQNDSANTYGDGSNI